MIAQPIPELSGRLGDGLLAVETRGLAKRFRKTIALDGVDLTVAEQSVYVLVGPNGAGKTTLFRILLDLVRADAGSSSLWGLSPRLQGPEVRVRIGFVPEARQDGCRSATVGELLDHHAHYYPRWDAAYARTLASALDLRPEARSGTLSKGEARRVQLVQALAHRPPLLLLDEPTDGLDPLARDTVLALLADHLADSPTTVLISTHHVQEVERLADCIGVLRRGRLVAQLRRDTLDATLRRYHATVPEDWVGPATPRNRHGLRSIWMSTWFPRAPSSPSAGRTTWSTRTSTR